MTSDEVLILTIQFGTCVETRSALARKYHSGEIVAAAF